MGRRRSIPEPRNPLRERVVPSDPIEVVIGKLREEASWFPEDGKTYALLMRAAEELEKRND